MDSLKKTIRLEIAKNSERAYTNLPIPDSLTLLNLNKNELLDFCKQLGWNIDNSKQLVMFNCAVEGNTKVPYQEIIGNSLGYAMELEKIV